MNPTDTVNTAHAINQARKAARIARTAIDMGVTVASLDRLLDEDFRAQVLAATPSSNWRENAEPYTDASTETWSMVFNDIVAMTEARA